MAPPAKCPDKKWFLKLAEGRLTPEQEQKLSRHLEHCQKCQKRVEQGSDFSKYLPGDTLPNPTETSTKSNLNQRLDQIKMASPSRTITAASGYLDVAPWLEPSESTLGKIAEFEFIDFIGRGGMGVVFRCLDTKLQRPVAIKLMAPHLIVDPSASERFVREAQSAAKINHPNIVTVHAADSIRGLPYLVMELIEGESLDAALNREKFNAHQIIDFATKLFQGLDAAHSRGVLHRDIKPANIMLDSTQGIKITDFGLACSQEGTKLTQTGLLVGTPEYLSPEQANQTGFDERSDLFSLGVVIHTMCSGQSPFSGPSVVSTIDNVRTINPCPLVELNSSIPAWFDAITQRLLAKNPDDRFPSAKAVLQAIQEKHCPTVSPRIRVQTTAQKSRTTPKVFWTQNRIAISLMALTLVVSAITVFWLFNYINNRDRAQKSAGTDDQVQDFNVQNPGNHFENEDHESDREERLEVTVSDFDQLVDAFDQNVSQLVITIDSNEALEFSDCLHIEEKEVIIQSSDRAFASLNIELSDSAALIINEGSLSLINIQLHCSRDLEPSEEVEGLIQCIHGHLKLENVSILSNDERPCIELTDSSGEIVNTKLAAPSSVIWWDHSEGSDELEFSNSILIGQEVLRVVAEQSVDLDFSRCTIVSGTLLAMEELASNPIANVNADESVFVTQNGLIEIEDIDEWDDFDIQEAITFKGSDNRFPEILFAGSENVPELLFEKLEENVDFENNSAIKLSEQELNDLESLLATVLNGDFVPLEKALMLLQLQGADFARSGPRNRN